MREVLQDAGIDNFAPHSFIAASASVMLKNGVPVGDIMKSAGWSRTSTFHRFYNKSVEGHEKQEGKKTIGDYFKKSSCKPVNK